MSAEVVFIGLGNMGLPMATNLVRGGLTVMGFDLVAENVSKLVAEGGVQGASLADAVRQAGLSRAIAWQKSCLLVRSRSALSRRRAA